MIYKVAVRPLKIVSQSNDYFNLLFLSPKADRFDGDPLSCHEGRPTVKGSRVQEILPFPQYNDKEISSKSMVNTIM